jgi:hypothetical protein
VPQTQVELPAEQPITPEALATTQLPETPAEPPRTLTPPRRTLPSSPAPPKQQTTEAPAPPPAQPPAAEPERPAIGEIVPVEELKRLQASAQEEKRAIRQIVEQAQGRRLRGTERGLVGRVEQFVRLSDEAEASGNMRQAYELAHRGLILAKELQVAR